MAAKFLFAVCGVRGRNQKIVGGSETHPNEYPWVAGLFKQNKLYCGATVVTNKFLITAAHCVSSFEPYEIRVSMSDVWSSDRKLIELVASGLRWWTQHLERLLGNQTDQENHRARRLRHLHVQQRHRVAGARDSVVLQRESRPSLSAKRWPNRFHGPTHARRRLGSIVRETANLADSPLRRRSDLVARRLPQRRLRLQSHHWQHDVRRLPWRPTR